MPNKKFLIILILFSIVYLDHDTNSENELHEFLTQKFMNREPLVRKLEYNIKKNPGKV